MKLSSKLHARGSKNAPGPKNDSPSPRGFMFFPAKTLVAQKKTLPLPRFLRDDNIMSNLLIKTNLVLTILEWKI